MPSSSTSSSSNILIQEEIIADCLLEAQHPDSPESQLNSLQTLSSLTKVSTHNRTLLSQLPDSVPTFVSLSLSPSPPIQTLALSVLFNLSLNPNLKQTLASHPNLLTNLNSILLSPVGPTKNADKLAASLFCSLATLDKNKAAFGVSGSVPVIVRATENTSIAVHLLSCLAELVRFHGNATLAVRAGAVPALFGILRGPAGEGLGGSCLATLALLAMHEEGVGGIRAEEGAAEVLVEGMRRGCMVGKEAVSEILIRMFGGGAHHGEFVREVTGREEFSSLVADLAIRGSARARENAEVIMRVVMEEADLEGYLEGNPWFLV